MEKPNQIDKIYKRNEMGLDLPNSTAAYLILILISSESVGEITALDTRKAMVKQFLFFNF